MAIQGQVRLFLENSYSPDPDSEFELPKIGPVGIKIGPVWGERLILNDCLTSKVYVKMKNAAKE